VAAPKRGRSGSAQSRPWRPLGLILIAIAALTGGMFASGHTTPRLGIDLAGGTSITLRAVPEKGQESAINKTNMDTAVDIMNRRVNGLGVSEAEVQTQGDKNIIVNIPKGTNSKEARQQVGTTAKLYFRPVLTTEVSGGAAATPSPTASSSASNKATLFSK
jgi:preprotein translocase subunit SecD